MKRGHGVRWGRRQRRRRARQKRFLPRLKRVLVSCKRLVRDLERQSEATSDAADAVAYWAKCATSGHYRFTKP